MKKKTIITIVVMACIIVAAVVLIFYLRFFSISLPYAEKTGILYAAYSDETPKMRADTSDIFGRTPAMGCTVSEAYQIINSRPFDDETVYLFKEASLKFQDPQTVLVYIPNKFYVPLMPDGVPNLLCCLSSNWYSFVNSQNAITFVIALDTAFNEELDNRYKNTAEQLRLSDSKTYGLPSQNYICENGITQIFTLEDNGRKMCVFLERSLLGKCEWIHLYCVQEDVCYYVSVPWEGNERTPPLEWLLSFGVTEYTE